MPYTPGMDERPSELKTTALAGRAGPGQSGLRGKLFARVMDRIFGYFLRLCGSRSDAEDLTQDTLLRLERSLTRQEYDPTRSFNRWMWIKAHSVWVEHCRKRRERPVDPHLLPAPPATLPDTDARLDARELLAELRRELDAEVFEVFVLYYGEQSSLSAIAATIGRDRKTVRARLDVAVRAARRKLR